MSSRVVLFSEKDQKEDITGIGIALVCGTEAAETVYNNHKYGVYVCIGQYDESLIKKMGIWETLIRSDLIKILSKMPFVTEKERYRHRKP